MKILIIEDNRELASSIFEFLTRESCICENVYSFKEAFERLSTFSYDCVLLDIMLPDGSGLEILQHIKEESPKAGILIISAKDALGDKIQGLEKGSDDYITKPFHLTELHARIRAIYRRKTLDGSHLISCGQVLLNTNTMELSIGGQVLDTTRKEFELMLYFLVNKNRVLSRQSIAVHLWGDYTDNMANFDFVYQHVKNLRKKISQVNRADYIETIYGLGYKFNAIDL